MGTEKRERQKANRQQKIAADRKAEERAGLKQRLIFGGAILVLFLGGLFLYSVLAGDDSADVTGASSDDAAQSDDAQSDDTVVPDEQSGEEVAEAADCPAEDGSSERTLEFAAAPPACLDPAATYQALVSTDRGDFTIDLDAAKAPNTVNNFVFLARYHYYDGVEFHRIIPGFVVQGGDAVGDPVGTGGPGYTFDDELPEAGEYEIGSVAMANSGTNTNGSQFFVVTGESGAALPPQYSLFGTVTEGLDVVADIEATGSESGTPSESTVINSITITQS